MRRFVQGGHCNFLHRVPKDLPTILTTDFMSNNTALMGAWGGVVVKALRY